jgi:DNA-binding NtrC family response regulator
MTEFGLKVRGWLKREPRVEIARTIAVVDANESSRQATAKLLENLGYQSLQMESTAEIVKHLEDEDDPTFVLLGFELADGDGLDALVRIRELAPEVPVVMLAANVWDARTAEALRRGAVAYLAPPFGQDALREIVGQR